MTWHEPTLESFLEYIQKNETLQLALTEAVHRYYYDHCFSPYTERPSNSDFVTTVHNLHKNLTCLHPDWRLKLRDKLKRYRVDDAYTNTNFVFNKPREIIELLINPELKKH